MAYVGNQPVPQATQTRDRFVATSGQTSFATSGYTPNFLDVYLDGVKLDSSEYTATNGSDVVLASGASTGQIMEVVAFSSFDVADIRNMTQPLGLKNYTTTERNALTGIGSGDTIYNSTTGSVEFYDGANWIATNLIPIISSVSGTIYSGVSSTLTLSVSSTTETVDIKYFEGGTLLATDTAVTVTSNSCTSTVPSAVYGQTVGDTISIQVFNLDGTPSNAIVKTVVGTPSGGTITTSGSYRIHTFTSSSSFVVPSGVSLSDVEHLVIAGGGAGGDDDGGGGGAGGYRSSVTGQASGGGASAEAKLSLPANTYTVTIGAGGTGANDSDGTQGSNSVFHTITSVGGGFGRDSSDASTGGSGGSGGGGSLNGAGGSGTSGQGYAAGPSSYPGHGAGGGGAGSAGTSGTSSTGGNGGNGVSSNINGTSTTRAGGGGGGGNAGHGSGGSGGGGNGVSGGTGGTPGDGVVNTGSGGGGGNNPTIRGGNGGSGIIIIRYQLT